MRTRLEPRTWLLLAMAGWAVLCTMVAMSGFGDHYELLPDPASSTHKSSELPAPAAHPTMGALETYAEAYNHPLFYADRKPVAVHVPGQDSTPAQPLDVALTSVIMTPTLQMAIVEDPKTKENLRVREGQPIGGAYAGWKLTGLSPRSATFDGGSQGQTTLDLRVFDGRGGEEPTRMGLTPQAVASGVLGPPRGVVPPDPNAANQQPDQADPNNGEAAVASTTVAANNNAAAEVAAQQAEQIRQRIEERRRQAQSQRAASNNKD